MLRMAFACTVILPLIIASPTGNALASSTSTVMEESEARQIQTAASAPVSLIMAVAIAEYRSHGRAVHASAENYDGHVLYDIKTVTPNDVTQLTVDPNTGTVVYMGHPMISGMKSGSYGFIELGKTTAPKVSLVAAISIAESSANGRGLQARLSTRNGQLVFQLDVVTKGFFITEIEVDAMSGKVTWMVRGATE